MSCDTLYIIVEFEYGNLSYEYELRYSNNNGDFQNTLCLLKYCDILPGQDPKKIEEKMQEIAKLLGLTIVYTIVDLAKKRGESS